MIDGKHHWRAYSLTSDPGRPDGCISITPKLVEDGVVSPFFVRQAKPGAIVRLGGVEGTFKLPSPLPKKLLFISAGSGITPVMSMLRHLERCDHLDDVVHLHSARTEDDAIFGDQLRRLDERYDGYHLHLQLTGSNGRLTPDHFEERCPDWTRARGVRLRARRDARRRWSEHWCERGDRDRLHMERFQPIIGKSDAEQGEGGTIRFTKSDLEARSDGSQPILVAGEEAGGTLPFGCRMGICHTCVGKLCSGKVRDLRTGEVSGSQGEVIRTCVNAPEGDIEIAL